MLRAWFVAVAVVASAAACVHSNEVECADGRICPAGTACDDVHQLCIDPAAAAMCTGATDDTPCTTNMVAGACRGGICEPVDCGDGIRLGIEQCDGSDFGSATCVTAGFYAPDGLACTSNCTFDTSQCMGRCGDNLINGSELCDGAPPVGTCIDDGFDAGALACSASCGASFDGCARFGFRPSITPLVDVAAVSGSDANDLWIGGALDGSAALAHFDGAKWTPYAGFPGQLALLAIAQAGSGDVWAIAEGSGIATTVEHFAGGQAVESGLPPGDYTDVIAFGPTAVFVAGHGVEEWDGMSWQPVGTLTTAVASVRGSSPTDLWVTGTDGSVANWNGATWTDTPLTGVATLVDPVGPGDAWLIGTTDAQHFIGMIARWDGDTWTVVQTDAEGTYNSIAAFADNDCWVALGDGAAFHFDGTAWTDTNIVAIGTGGLTALRKLRRAGDSAPTLAAVGFDGFAYTYAGQIYFPLTAQAGGSPTQRGTVAVTFSADDTYLGDIAGRVLHFDGEVWTISTTTGGAAVQAMTATGPSDVWLSTGSDALFHFDGLAWSRIGLAPGAKTLWDSGPQDLYITTDSNGPGLAHYRGGSDMEAAIQVMDGGAFAAVTGTGPDNVWALETHTEAPSTLFHWNGVAWSNPIPAGHVLSALYAVGTTVFAIADTNAIMQFEDTDVAGASVTPLPAGSALTLLAGTARDDVFVAAAEQLFHFDGASWSPVRAPLPPFILPTYQSLSATPGVVDLLVATSPPVFERLVRTRFWNCRAKETDCFDGVDDDCDGLVDGDDHDCAP